MKTVICLINFAIHITGLLGKVLSLSKKKLINTKDRKKELNLTFKCKYGQIRKFGLRSLKFDSSWFFFVLSSVCIKYYCIIVLLYLSTFPNALQNIVFAACGVFTSIPFHSLLYWQTQPKMLLIWKQNQNKSIKNKEKYV